jgi:hypothetical protein
MSPPSMWPLRPGAQGRWLAVDVLLISDAGDITGAGAQAFKALGKEAAKISLAERDWRVR